MMFLKRMTLLVLAATPFAGLAAESAHAGIVSKRPVVKRESGMPSGAQTIDGVFAKKGKTMRKRGSVRPRFWRTGGKMRMRGYRRR